MLILVFDLTDNAVSISLAEQMWKEGKIVSAICHGPAALTNIKDPNGKNIVSGRKVTCFSNEEEEQVKLTDAIPYLVETRLKEVLRYLFDELIVSWAENMPRILRLGDLGWKSTDNSLRVPIQAVEKILERRLSKLLRVTKMGRYVAIRKEKRSIKTGSNNLKQTIKQPQQIRKKCPKLPLNPYASNTETHKVLTTIESSLTFLLKKA